MSRSKKRKAKELVQIKRKLKNHDKQMPCVILGQDSEPGQKKKATKDIISTIDEILTWAME